ncbi:hypothetical protein KC678_01855 [Candidatus Dojkabacteria bacterium]|uniref:Uncharacterized protein n=1 Tax=Candidatus Dojkabacteria bacterium TaxID=2099670 RepID=A0A955IF52_9BACT|nr:hypothetical protein [Candidatus Dojkabacteria bacterium]
MNFADQITGQEQMPNTKYLVHDNGVVEIDLESAYLLYQTLENMESVSTNPDDYDEETGLHQLSKLIEVKTPDESHVIKFTTHSGCIFSHTVDGVETIYPTMPAGRPHEPGDILRGGELSPYPHVCEDLKYSTENIVNYHGWLARSLTFPVTLDYNNGVFIFALSPKHIASPHEDGHMVFVSYLIEENGSYVKTLQTFNFGRTDIYLNEGYHPYIDTRNNKVLNVSIGGISHRIEQLADRFKTLDRILLNGSFNKFSKYLNRNLFPEIIINTKNFDVLVQPVAGFSENSTIALWTESRGKFICPEFIRVEDQPLNPKKKNHGYAVVKPGGTEFFAVKMSIANKVS